MNAPFDGSSEGRKEKKTRRRLRLSCVECTKRRQKCDRNYPCSLCVSRGVSHLCRWETVPVARPQPARPPPEALRATSTPETDSIIRELSARVALLERALAEQKSQHPSPPGRSSEGEEPTSTPSPQSNFSFGDNTTSTRTSPELNQHPTPSFPPVAQAENKPKDEDLSCDAFLHDELYEATSTLAQLSLGHHGEYVGRGSILCALHSISTKNIPRFFYANSTEPTGAKRESTYRFSALPSYTDIDSLLRIIPPVEVVKTLADAFFSENNWRFGIPEQWFHTACSHMWSVVQYSALQGAETNASWLMLLFAILASAPAHVYKEVSQYPSVLTSDDYFMCAMMARRIAEDDYLRKPTVSMLSSPADGTVLGCLSIPLLASYLAERGRVSEAWKLIGNGVRNAIAVGLHRDPTWKLWQIMSEDERILRRRAWWGLYIWDKLCSYLLGRPHMVRRQVCDVTLPPPVDADGVRNMFNLGQGLMLKLVNYITDCMDTCFGAKYPDSVTFLEMANNLSQWEAEIPPEYRQGHVLTPSDELTSQDILMLARQRYILYTWYLFGRLKLVVAATTGNPVRTAESPAARKECLERCIIYSMELIRFQCDAYESITIEKNANPTVGAIYPGNSWLFSGCFSLFEASVALLTTLAKYSWHEQMVAAGRLIGRVLDVLAEVRLREEGKAGETASMAIEVLTALRDEKLWKSDSHASSVVQNSPESWNGGDSSNSPDQAGPIPSMYVDQIGEQPTFGQPLLSNHYNVSAIRGDARSQGPKFSTNILTPDGPPSLPARLS